MENLNDIKVSLKENLIEIKSKDLLDNKEDNSEYLLEGMKLWRVLNKELKTHHINSLDWQQTLLDDLLVGGVSIEDYYERIGEIIDNLESILKEYNKDNIKLGEKLKYRKILVEPLDLLVVVYVYKHKDFKVSLEEFHNEGHTKEFLSIFR